jgi:hypothetical protein
MARAEAVAFTEPPSKSGHSVDDHSKAVISPFTYDYRSTLEQTVMRVNVVTVNVRASGAHLQARVKARRANLARERLRRERVDVACRRNACEHARMVHVAKSSSDGAAARQPCARRSPRARPLTNVACDRYPVWSPFTPGGRPMSASSGHAAATSSNRRGFTPAVSRQSLGSLAS